MAESFATGGVGDAQLRYRDDEPCAQPAVTVEAFKGQTNATAVRLESGEDARELLAMLDRLTLVVVHFPAFTDGRGYSMARILRERYGYAGEIRATGDVLCDQASLMTRCGFDAFDLAPHVSVDDWLEVLALVDVQYQPAADRRQSAAQLRHAS